MGHLNSFSASGGGNLNKTKNFPKIEMPGGCPGGMFKLRFDWYITGGITLHVIPILFRDDRLEAKKRRK